MIVTAAVFRPTIVILPCRAAPGFASTVKTNVLVPTDAAVEGTTSHDALLVAIQLQPGVSVTVTGNDPALASVLMSLKTDVVMTHAAGTGTGAGEATVTEISLVGPLAPHAFFALTRTKYVPGATFAATKVVASPTSAIAMFARPAVVPASRTYDVAAAPATAAVHRNVVVVPLTVAVRPEGALGAHAGGPAAPTTSTTSFDAALIPQLFVARTRT